MVTNAAAVSPPPCGDVDRVLDMLLVALLPLWFRFKLRGASEVDARRDAFAAPPKGGRENEGSVGLPRRCLSSELVRVMPPGLGRSLRSCDFTLSRGMSLNNVY